MTENTSDIIAKILKKSKCETVVENPSVQKTILKEFNAMSQNTKEKHMEVLLNEFKSSIYSYVDMLYFGAGVTKNSTKKILEFVNLVKTEVNKQIQAFPASQKVGKVSSVKVDPDVIRKIIKSIKNYQKNLSAKYPQSEIVTFKKYIKTSAICAEVLIYVVALSIVALLDKKSHLRFVLKTLNALILELQEKLVDKSIKDGKKLPKFGLRISVEDQGIEEPELPGDPEEEEKEDPEEEESEEEEEEEESEEEEEEEDVPDAPHTEFKISDAYKKYIGAIPGTVNKSIKKVKKSFKKITADNRRSYIEKCVNHAIVKVLNLKKQYEKDLEEEGENEE